MTFKDKIRQELALQRAHHMQALDRSALGDSRVVSQPAQILGKK